MNNNQDISYTKKLQSLSADFELTPAADSWNKIETQLPVKRKRRFIFFIIPVGIVILLAGVFVFSNDGVISDSGNSIAHEGNSEQSRSSVKGVNRSGSNSNMQWNKIEIKANTKTISKDVSNSSNENQNTSAIGATGNTLSTASILLKNHHAKKPHSPVNENASNDLMDVKSNEQSSAVTNKNEIANQELTKMLLINGALITNNNQPPVGINFQQTKQTKKSSRWSVGLAYLPMFTNRKVSYDLQSSNQAFIDDTSYKKKDEYLFSHNYGIDIYYTITSKLYLHSGLYSITYGEKSFYDNKVFQNIIANPFTALDYASYIVPGSEQQHINKYSFFQLPISVGMKIRTGSKTSLNVEPGFTYGYLTRADALEYMTINDTIKLNALDDAQLNRMNRNIFFVNASISFDWHLMKNLSWCNGFMAQYQLTDLYHQDEIQSQHNYGFGLQTNLIFHFK